MCNLGIRVYHKGSFTAHGHELLGRGLHILLHLRYQPLCCRSLLFELGVWGFSCMVQGSGLGCIVQGLGFRVVHTLCCTCAVSLSVAGACCLGLGVCGLGCRVQGFKSRVQGRGLHTFRSPIFCSPTFCCTFVKGMAQLFLPTPKLKSAPRSWGTHPPPQPSLKREVFEI